MEADHESDDALREGAGEWRWVSIAVVGWSEAMAALGMGEVGDVGVGGDAVGGPGRRQ